MTFTAGTSVIPSDEITVSSSTTTLPAANVSSVGYVGVADLSTDQGNANTNEVYFVQNSNRARTLFGDDSELTRQINLAFTNGIGNVYAVAVPSTDETENFSSTDTGTLSNAPVFDPNLHPNHEITEDNQSEEITIVYDDTPPTPTSGISLNPITGDWAAAASGAYDISYSYGDYTTAAENMAAEAPRTMSVLTEDETIISNADGTLQNNASNFLFTHNISGLTPVGSEQTTSDYVTGTDTLPVTSSRTGLVASSRGFTDSDETTEVRMSGVAAAMDASKTLGTSITSDTPSGIVSLRDSFSIQEMSTLMGNGVMPIGVYGGINVIQDRMTSDESGFQRLYANEVIDEGVRRIHEVSIDYIGEQSSDINIRNYNRGLRTQLLEMRDDTIPKLDAFDIDLTQQSDGDLDGVITLDVIDIIDNITIDAVVGDILNVEVQS